MKKQLLSTLIFLSLSFSLFATHNHSGEIIFKQISQFEIEATVITYTFLSSIAADRDTLTICWGDGTCQIIGRTNGPGNNGEIISPYIKKNEYKMVHTYPGMATYIMSVTDPNRNGGILNLNFPNSDQIPFEIATKVELFNLVLNSPNNSPILLQPPIDVAFKGEPFLHTPNAFDIDGDSIAYELITPLSAPNYAAVTEVGAGPENTLTLNEETGLIVWDAPQVAGLYTIAYKVKSFRNGQMVDYVIRDMTIEVVENPGTVPDIVIENITGNEEIIFVELGDTVKLTVEVSDLDANQEISITSTCGLYEYFDNNAVFNSTSNGNSGTATFTWIVKNEHIRQQPYQVVFKGEDDTLDHAKSKLAVVRYKTQGFPTNTVDLFNDGKLSLFPNPIKDGWVNLDFDGLNAIPEKYSIYDSSGRRVLEGGFSAQSSAIRVKQLSQGYYYLVLKTGLHMKTASFIVQ